MDKSTIIYNEATSIDEWILLPGLTRKDCIPSNVDVTQEAHGIFFRFPMMPASMSCLYTAKKHDLAVTSAREGMPPVIHYNQTIDDQVLIINAVKAANIPVGGIERIDEPVSIDYRKTLKDVVELTEKYGHSVIPVVDRTNVLHGVFIRPFGDITIDPDTPITQLKKPLYYPLEDIEVGEEGISDKKIAGIFDIIHDKGMAQNFLPLIGEGERLAQFVFQQKFPAYFCGAALSTQPGWEDRAKACAEAGTDFFVIDTSDGYSEFELDVLKGLKDKYPDIPRCGGNWITADAFEYFKDYIDFGKIGMMTGTACRTGFEKGVGSPLFEPLREIREARDRHYEETNHYVYLIGDGGVRRPYQMAIVLKLVDLMMGGSYFARFYESAGKGRDKDGNFTDNEDLIVEKEYFGEGSLRARNRERYEQEAIPVKSLLVEGDYGFVPHVGRLKPNVESEFKAVINFMCNAGCMSLAEYRQNARIRKLSEKGMEERLPSPAMKVEKDKQAK